MKLGMIEKRTSLQGRPVEARAGVEGQKGPGTIRGYGAVFNEEADLFGDGTFLEVIRAGAFEESLSDPELNAYGKIQHEGGLSVVGRTRNGTMRVEEDEVGLLYEIDLPDTQAGRDIFTLVERQDIDGSSFAFQLRGDPEEAQRIARPSPGILLRELLNLTLHDTGPVANPAYARTTVEARSAEVLEELRAALPAEEEELDLKLERRRRLLEHEEALTPQVLKEDTSED